MSQAKRITLLWGMVAMSLVGDFLLPWSIYHLTFTVAAIIGAGLIGVAAAQMGIVATWCALANQAAIVRLPVALSIAAIKFFAFLLECYRVEPDLNLSLIMFFTMAATVMFLGMLIPLGLIRLLLRRRIGLKSQRSAARSSGKFTIRYLMVATATIAVMIALIQAVVPSGQIDGEPLLWLAMIFIVGLFAFFSAAVTIPSLWFVMAEHRSIHSSGLVSLFVGWSAGPILIVVILASFGIPVGGAIGYFFAFGTSACGTMIAGLLVLRVMGYRLMHQFPDGTLAPTSDTPPLPDQSSFYVPPNWRRL